MRTASSWRRPLAASLGLVAVVGLVVTGSSRADHRPVQPAALSAAAANAALHDAANRSADATESLRLARVALATAQVNLANRRTLLARANSALAAARRANGAYLARLATVTAADQRASTALTSAQRQEATGRAAASAAAKRQQSADVAVGSATAAVAAAQARLDEILAAPAPTSPEETTPTSPSSDPTEPSSGETTSPDPSSTDSSSTDPTSTDPSSTDPSSTDASSTDPTSTDASSTSTDPTSTDPSSTDPSRTDTSSPSGPLDVDSARAALTQAQQALADAQTAQLSAHQANVTAQATLSRDQSAAARATATWRSAHAALGRVTAQEPSLLHVRRLQAATATTNYQRAEALVHSRNASGLVVRSRATAAQAAFRTATAQALQAVQATARAPQCAPGNVAAGAQAGGAMSAPGLHITRYTKAGRTPMWVTAVNLTGPGAQIRPGPLTPPAVASRTQQSAQLAGSHALAAVNGDFYYINQDNSPWGPEITPHGRILKGSAHPQWQSLIVQNNGVATLGYLSLAITVRHGAAVVSANSLNSHDLPRDGIAVLTSRWGTASRSVLHPSQVVREYAVTSHGVVSSVTPGISTRRIPAGGLVIVAQGAALHRMSMARIGRGSRISVTTKVSSNVRGGAYSAIGVGLTLIQNGVDRRLGCQDDQPVARTIVGIKPGGQEMFVVTVQGQTDSARTAFAGLTVRQAQGVMRALGAYDAAMFDGGGSTILTAHLGGQYRMLTRSPGSIRPVANSFAFWPR